MSDVEIVTCLQSDYKFLVRVDKMLITSLAKYMIHTKMQPNRIVEAETAFRHNVLGAIHDGHAHISLVKKQKEKKQSQLAAEEAITIVLEHICNEKRSFFGKLSSALGISSKEEIAHMEDAIVKSGKFPRQEREKMCEELIGRFDTKNEEHCVLTMPKSELEDHRSNNCPLRPVYCQNEGCGERISVRWLEMHDFACPFKLVDCPRRCAVKVARKDVEDHVTSHCMLRPARCMYWQIGCSWEGTAGDCESHVNVSASDHLLLVMGALRKNRQATEGIKNDAVDVQLKMDHLFDASASLESSTKRDFQELQHGLQSKLQQQLQLDIKILTKSIDSCEKQVGSITSDTKSLQTQMDALKSHLTKDAAAASVEVEA